MKSHAVVALAVVGVILLAAFPKALGGQGTDSQSPNQRDLAARKTALLTETSDLEAMAKSLDGAEFSTAMSLDNKASQGVMELDATYWFVDVYEHMQSEQDRAVAKAVLKYRLSFYSYLLGLEADQTAGYLAFAQLPATAQAGARIKDDLRAAKAKLDEIAASLN